MGIFTKATITATKKLGEKIYKMDIYCPEAAKTAVMGQFLNIYPDKGEMILPRPISIQAVNREKGVLSIIYHIAGKGTAYLATVPAGSSLGIAGPLGSGFKYKGCKKLALIGGGIGVPPLYYSAVQILQTYTDIEIRAYIGFRDKDAVILEEEFNSLGIKTIVTTDDGGYGIKGNALNGFKADGFTPESIYTCGPYGMLKAVANHAISEGIHCQVSMEERMACGIGACVGCAIAINTAGGDYTYKKVCKDGPVFLAEEVVWQ